MNVDDLKRAVEDVMLRPDENRLDQANERFSIAALDLCQASGSGGMQQPCSASSLITEQQDTSIRLPRSLDPFAQTIQQTNQLTSNASTDQVNSDQSLTHRPSLGSSRRSNRIVPLYAHNKRKRSNSVSSVMNRAMIHHARSSDGQPSTFSSATFTSISQDSNVTQCFSGNQPSNSGDQSMGQPLPFEPSLISAKSVQSTDEYQQICMLDTNMPMHPIPNAFSSTLKPPVDQCGNDNEEQMEFD